MDFHQVNPPMRAAFIQKTDTLPSWASHAFFIYLLLLLFYHKRVLNLDSFNQSFLQLVKYVKSDKFLPVILSVHLLNPHLRGERVKERS